MGTRTRGFGFTVAMNLITLAVMLTTAEVGLRSAEDNGVAPLLVYFPTPSDVERRSKALETGAQRALKMLDIPVLDTTPCLIKAGSAKAIPARRSPLLGTGKCRGREMRTRRAGAGIGKEGNKKARRPVAGVYFYVGDPT